MFGAAGVQVRSCGRALPSRIRQFALYPSMQNRIGAETATLPILSWAATVCANPTVFRNLGGQVELVSGAGRVVAALQPVHGRHGGTIRDHRAGLRAPDRRILVAKAQGCNAIVTINACTGSRSVRLVGKMNFQRGPIGTRFGKRQRQVSDLIARRVRNKSRFEQRSWWCPLGSTAAPPQSCRCPRNKRGR